MQARLAAWLAIILVLGTGAAQAQQVPATEPAPAQRVGGVNAKVVIEEYSDFQCPYCGAQEMQFAAAVEQWVRQQRGAVRFDYYDVALRQHAYAAPAARAARCAGAQKRYSQARHAIFADQQKWAGAGAPDAVSQVTGLAKSVVQDSLRFDRCMLGDSTRVNRTLEANLQRARNLGVPGTPTFVIFVGEHMAQLVDPVSPDSMATVIRSLKAKP